MAKRIKQSEQTANAKSTIARLQKFKPERLSRATREGLTQLSNELKGKCTMTTAQKQMYNRLKAQAQTEQEQAERKQWKFRQQVSERRLERDIARKIKGKGESEKLKEYEKDFGEGIKKQLEKIKDVEYKVQYREYTVSEKQEILRKLLGIGSNGVTLSDGTTFTIAEFNEILDRYNIPLEKFIDEEDIRKERYKQVKYQEWKKSIDSDIKELITKPDLSPREREGLKKIFKVYGT